MANTQTNEAKATSKGTEVVKVVFDEQALRNLNSFEDAFKLVQNEFGAIADASEVIGDGFVVLDDKTQLVGRPMVLLNWHFSEGDYRDEDGNLRDFVSARVISQRPDGTVDKWVVNDGSTGLCDQLKNYSVRTNMMGGLLVQRGLRVSEYIHPTHGPAKTFYLDLQKEEPF